MNFKGLIGNFKMWLVVNIATLIQREYCIFETQVSGDLLTRIQQQNKKRKVVNLKYF